MLSAAIEILQSGGIVALPTETVYGLAVDARNDDAVSSLFVLKWRPLTKPLTIQVWSRDTINKYAEISHPWEQKIIDNFMPGAITLVLRKKLCISDIVTVGSLFVGVRIPSHPVTLELLRSLDFPLAVPSANYTGDLPAKTLQEVQNMFGGAVSVYIPNNGYVMSDIASTVVQIVDWKVVILREWPISLEEIEKVCV